MLNKVLNKYLFKRVIRNNSSTTNNIQLWLEQKGYTSIQLETLLKALQQYNMQPSVSLLESLGKKGIQDFLDSIAREEQLKMKNTNTKQIQVNIITSTHPMKRFSFQARIGQTLKDCMEENQELRMYLECACGGIAACSTCHLYVHEPYFKKIPAITSEEEDMLDLAADVTPHSRLGCQIVLDESCEGITFQIPPSVHNLYGR
jgi:2Fe-2S ferredoxin